MSRRFATDGGNRVQSKRSNILSSQMHAFAIVLTFFLGACSFFKQDCSRPDIFCVALVTDTGGLQDHGLTQSAWDDIQRAQADRLVQHSAYIESVDARDYGKNLIFFANQEYDVILSAGIGLRNETLRVADLKPATIFIGLDQPLDDSHPNFISLTFPEDQAGFLAGALAAHMTQTGIIGAACESSSLTSNWRTCEGFRAGAHYANPEVEVLIEYRDLGSQENLFRDREWGHATALSLIGDGADLIFGMGGGTGQGALIAAAEEQVYAIGSEQDQFYVTRAAQQVLLTSVLKRASPAVYDLISVLHNQGIFGTEYSGAVGIAPFHFQEAHIPEAVKDELIRLEMDLSQNIIQTGIPAEPPK